jgi:hypothetical protein
VFATIKYVLVQMNIPLEIGSRDLEEYVRLRLRRGCIVITTAQRNMNFASEKI